MIYSVDRDGWGRAFESLKEAEGYLEWLDVKEDEYAVLGLRCLSEWMVPYLNPRLRNRRRNDSEQISGPYR